MKIKTQKGREVVDVTWQNILSTIIMPSIMKELLQLKHSLWKKTNEEIRKLTTGKGKDYTTFCSLDYDSIKICYRVIAIHLRRQKELAADLEVTQQIEFARQLKYTNGVNDDGTQFTFVLIILKKFKEQN